MNSETPDSMDASLLQIERELQSLTPAAPGRELIRSLEVRMAPVPRSVQPARVAPFPWRRVVAPAAAAAAVAVLSVGPARRVFFPGKATASTGTDDPTAIKWEAMPMRSEYRALLNAGWVLNDNFEPVRQYSPNGSDLREWRVPAASQSHNRFIVPVPAGYGGDWRPARGVPFH